MLIACQLEAFNKSRLGFIALDAVKLPTVGYTVARLGMTLSSHDISRQMSAVLDQMMEPHTLTIMPEIFTYSSHISCTERGWS
jgi:hypothetical protein